MRVLGLLLLLPALAGGCARPRCCPRVQCPPAQPHVEVVRAAPPGASATWSESQRAAALEAVFELARARIAREAGAREEALAAYAQGRALLAAETGPAPLLALRRTLEEEGAALPGGPTETEAAREASAATLVFYDVRDLVAALGKIGLPRVEIVGPEGSRVESSASVLGGHLYTLLPAAQGPIQRQPLDELQTRGEVLLLRASAQRHAAMRTYLATLRAALGALGFVSVAGA